MFDGCLFSFTMFGGVGSSAGDWNLNWANASGMPGDAWMISPVFVLLAPLSLLPDASWFETEPKILQQVRLSETVVLHDTNLELRIHSCPLENQLYQFETFSSCLKWKFPNFCLCVYSIKCNRCVKKNLTSLQSVVQRLIVVLEWINIWRKPQIFSWASCYFFQAYKAR